MHIQIITFNLKNLSEADYRAICDTLAPAFAEVPGLIAKVWLADQTTNTYGGVYTWLDREAMEAFAKSELFHAVVTHPNLANITSRDFGVLAGPSRVTQGRAAVAV